MDIGADLQQAFDEGYEEAKKVYQKAFEDIKSEIKRKANSGQWSEATIYGLHKALAIIDKHNPDKAESEETDGISD